MANIGAVVTFGLSLNHRPQPNSPENSSYTTDTGRESLRIMLNVTNIVSVLKSFCLYIAKRTFLRLLCTMYVTCTIYRQFRYVKHIKMYTLDIRKYLILVSINLKVEKLW